LSASHRSPAGESSPEPESEGVDRGTILVLNRDVFFGVKIGNTLRALGYAVAFVKETAAFVGQLAADGEPPVLGLVDMNVGVDWDAIATLRERGPVVPILVFGSHLDVEGRRAAKAAGVRRIVSNGDFHRDMVALVQRYATPRPA
jgi:hypothetical protein